MAIKLRIKLSDFMDMSVEDEIMEKIADIHRSSTVAFELTLWYDKGNLEQGAVGRFLAKWESKMRNKTHVIAHDNVIKSDFIFFNIVENYDAFDSKIKRSTLVNEDVNYRFEYAWNGHPRMILTGLDKFKHALNFGNSDRVVRKQKRSD